MFAVAHATICIGRRRYIQREMLIDEGAVLGRHVLIEPPEQLKALQLLQMTIIKIGKRKKTLVSLSCGGDGGAFLKSNYLIVICNNCNAWLESAPRALDV